jgi:multidrug resistance efflux pump
MPDELDGMLIVAPARAWLALLALAVALGGLAAYGFFGRLPHEVTGSGLLADSRGGLADVQSTAAGQVMSVQVTAGQRVRTGETVATLAGDRTLRAPFSGTVEDVDVTRGQVITRGDELYTLQPPQSSKTSLTALLFLTPKDGASVGPGMKVILDVASAPSSAYGVLRGKVSSVSSYPASEQTLTALLGNPTLAATLSQKGAPLIARVRLLTDSRTKSGLQWSTPDGPPFPLTPGVTVSARVIQSEQSPVKQLFGS